MTIINVDSINPSDMIKQFDLLYQAKQPALILGAPGLGKSAIVKQWAESKGYNLVTRMLSQTQPGDLSIPFFDKEDGVLHWAVADWLVQLPKDRPTIFFFDELPSAPIDVRTAIYQIVLDRQLGGHKLPDNSYIIAAGNRVTDNASAFDIDTALADRFTHFVLEANPKQWLNWATQNNIHPTVLTFIQTNPHMLIDEDNMTELVKVSPRSWEKVSDILHINSNPEQVELIIQGRIGLNNTAKFLIALREINELPNIEVLMKANDKELARLAPTTVNGLYGLTYTLNAWATTKKKLAQAMRVFLILCDNSPVANREEIKVTGIGLLGEKAINKGWILELIQDDNYKQYVREFVRQIPSLADAASFINQ